MTSHASFLITGKVVSGWKVENSDTWTLIGKRSPQQPQMFYPLSSPQLTLSRGDTVAARCTMVNTRDRATDVGPTNADEMCNFYIMYWVEGDQPMKKHTCFSLVKASDHILLNVLGIMTTIILGSSTVVLGRTLGLYGRWSEEYSGQRSFSVVKVNGLLNRSP